MTPIVALEHFYDHEVIVKALRCVCVVRGFIVVASSSFIARPLAGCRICYGRRLWHFAVSVPRASRFVTQAEPSSLVDVVLVHFWEGLDPPDLMRTSDVGCVPPMVHHAA